jgi:hypothetical protein
MAQLHGRIFGLSHRRRGLGARGAAPLALLLLLGPLGWATPAGAEGLTGVERLAQGLRSDEPGVREKALRSLSRLDVRALPAIRARAAELGRAPLDADQARGALHAFRHATGSRRADDAVDLIEGVLPVLAQRGDAVAVGMAERLALMRALEGMGTLEAGEVLCDLMGLEQEHPWPWRWEARRIAERMGSERALPTLMVATVHRNRFVRRWGLEALEAHPPPGPGDALRRAEERGPVAVADLLRAWGKARVMDAMPTVTAFVNDPRRKVREAARAGVEGYGRNIIWQLRRAYHLQTGREAERSWSTERTRTELYAAVDRERLRPARAALAAGLEALEAGDVAAMEAHFERALRDAPGEASVGAAMAAGWAALGDRRMAAGDYDGAARTYRRALWTAPEGDERAAWNARLTLAEAEADLSAGVVDVAGFRTAGAAGAVDRLTGAAAERKRKRQRYAAGLGALLLGLAGVSLLRRRSGSVRPDPDARPDHRETSAGGAMVSVRDEPLVQ